MRLRKQILSRNDCYRAGVPLSPAGVMVHSTGANNPRVSRYVPGNEEIGVNRYGNHWDRGDLAKCVHAFIGQFGDGSIGTVQTLPWNLRGWHAGTSKGNNRYIGFEICEDGLTDPVYFERVYREAVELTAYLCKAFCLDPLSPGVVICHAEGHKLGLASGHADVLHWFPKHGKTMDDFRADVGRLMNEEDEMTQEQFDKLMDNWMERQAKKAADNWAKPYIQEAIDAGIMSDVGGSIERPKAFVTRQELAVVAANLAEK